MKTDLFYQKLEISHRSTVALIPLDVSVARSFDESGDNYRFWWILTLTIRLYRTRRYTPQSLNQSPMVIDLAVGTINLNNEVRVPADNRKNRQEQW
jgi:hypothetical protein